MERPRVEQQLVNYVDVLTSATATCECPETQREYEERLQIANQLLAHWRGGSSESFLKGALMLELGLYESSRLSGREAEYVGRAFGELCRTVRVAI
jgi:hypothetical protein